MIALAENWIYVSDVKWELLDSELSSHDRRPCVLDVTEIRREQQDNMAGMPNLRGDWWLAVKDSTLRQSRSFHAREAEIGVYEPLTDTVHGEMRQYAIQSRQDGCTITTKLSSDG